jgi:tetratricopeptide (TPR) repeat protein
MIRKSALCACLWLAMAIAALGQNTQEDIQKCQSGSPDARIASCTALIQAGLVTTLGAGLFLPQRRSVLYNDRGVGYTDKGDYERAIRDFNEAIHLNPTSIGSFYSRGYAYKKKGDYDRAIQDFDEALRLDPHFDLAYYERGNSHIDKAEYDRAIQDFNQAILIRPNIANFYNNRGVAQYRKGDYGRAIEDFDQAIHLNANYLGAYDSRGYAHWAESDGKAALADFMHVISTAPSSSSALSSALMLHVIMEKQGHDDRAQLARVAAASDLSKWPGAVLKFDMGQMTADELIRVTAAAAPGSPQQKWQLCQANYFIGEDALLKHRRTIALEHLTAIRDSCAGIGSMAGDELKRMGVQTPPAK